MKLLELFRRGEKEAEALQANPYLNARRTWNEHVGAVLSSRQAWQAAALAAMLTALAAVGGLAYVASKSRFVPYVVEVDTLGRAAAVGRADAAAKADERVVHAALASFVADARAVSFDRSAQNAAIWRVFAMLRSGDPATAKITEYMKDPATSPTKRAEEFSVGVEIASVLRQTRETWEVNWTEKIWNRQGVRVEQRRMRALITAYSIPPTSSTTEDEIRKNPMGIFVRDFSWSRISE